MFHVLALDDIARAGLDRFPSDRYRVGFEGEVGHNIIDMLNKSRDAIAYTLVDVERPIEPEVVERIAATPGILSFRVIEAEPDPASAA